jgi:ubiquinone/menaquinone biosynthesis C-methylase UbiE
MKSSHADKFNHDPFYASYDTDVLDESHPIRIGYRKALEWIGTSIIPGSTVLDLGSGTGNTIAGLPTDCRSTAIDISQNMLDVARIKLTSRKVEYVVSDILQFLYTCPVGVYDAVVSSYSIHHLTIEEKQRLFSLIYRVLKPKGRAVFVALMFRNAAEQQALSRKYRNDKGVIESIEEEYYWDIELSNENLIGLGFSTEIKRFSDLSWGILAIRRT